MTRCTVGTCRKECQKFDNCILEPYQPTMSPRSLEHEIKDLKELVLHLANIVARDQKQAEARQNIAMFDRPLELKMLKEQQVILQSKMDKVCDPS